MDPEKIVAIVNQKNPRNIQNIRGFLDFTNFYRSFIKYFSKIVRPLMNLTKKNVKFDQTTEYERTFNNLKYRFTITPILTHFDPHLEYIIEIDSSDHA